MNGPTPNPSSPTRARAALEALGRPGRAGWIAALCVLTLAALMRFHGLGRDALWLDEGYSWWDAQQSLSDLFSLVPQCDPHPPLYFLLLKGWMKLFGDSVLALRFPSALLGIATTGLVFLAGREIAPRVGLVAGLLFAVTPFQIEFSHEARPYALLCFGAALIVFGALRVMRLMTRPASDGIDRAAPPAFEAGRPSAFGVGLGALLIGGTLMLWSNDTSVLFIAALGGAFVALLLGDRTARPFAKPLLLVFALMLLLWLPNVPLLIEQAEEVTSDFWIARPEGWRIANELRFLVSASLYDAVWWSVATIAGALILLRGQGAWRQALFLGMWIVVPVALNWGISMTIKPIYLARAMIAVAPAVVVALSAAALLLPTTTLRRAALVALVAAHLLGLWQWRERYLGKPRWDTVAMRIVKGAAALPDQRDALILLTANEMVLPLNHAFQDLHTVGPAVRGVPADFPAPGLKARYPSGKCAPSVQGQDLDWIKAAVAGRRTVYFVTHKDNIYDPGERVAKVLSGLGLTERDSQLFIPGYLELDTFVDTRSQSGATPPAPPARRPSVPGV